MHPDDAVTKSKESLNPFWKQIDEHDDLDRLLEETDIQQTWTEDYRKKVPIFKIVKQKGTNEIYQTQDGIDEMRMATMFASDHSN